MSPQEIDALRKEVKKLMVDLEMDGKKSKARFILAATLSEKMGRGITNNILCMALSGYRQTEAYQEILVALREILYAMLPPDYSTVGENIHLN